jgi:hypothetical protein
VSVYIHVPKEKRTKLDPSGKKGTFVGYSESSKAYWIYIHGQRQIEVSKDVAFEEEVAFRRSRGSHMEIDSERQEEIVPFPPHPLTVQRETVEPIDPIDLVDPVAPIDVPKDIAVGRKRSTWARQTLQEAEGHAAPCGIIRGSKRPHRYSCYAAAMNHIIDFEPSCYEEASSWPVWRDAMMEEYRSIMKNDVWDIVPRPEGKFVVTSKWIYKIKHIANGSIEKHKRDLLLEDFVRWRE